MEGASHTLAKALGDVLKEVDIQTQRRNALRAMHHAALIAADTRAKVLDTGTEQLREAAQLLAQQQQQALADTQKGFRRGDQEVSRMEETARSTMK